MLARSSAVALASVTEDRASSVEKIYRRILSRPPSMEELSNAIKFIESGKEKEKERWAGLAQNLLISNEFIFRD